MDRHEIVIEWEGPLTVDEVIDNKNDEGIEPECDGKDYGLYKIYGRHLLYGYDALLYIGKNTDETFSERFRTDHKKWLKDEKDIKVFIGRVDDPKKHTKDDEWESWKRDIDMAESILIYKYSPNYNSYKISKKPTLSPSKITLIHNGARYRLEERDEAPEHFYW